jgi:hypothetical protein
MSTTESKAKKEILTNVLSEDAAKAEAAEKSNNAEGGEKKKIEMVGSIPADAFLQWSPTPFKAFGATTRINSGVLARMIYASFRKTFHDLRGANIAFINGNFVLELYFENNTENMKEGSIRNLVNLVAPDPNNGSNTTNLYVRKRIVNNRNYGKTFTLNDETKLLLSDFMYGGRDNNKPTSNRWNNYIHEVHIPISDAYYRRGERILLRVVGLDLRKVLQMLYGRLMVTETISQGNGKDMNYRAVAFYEPRYIKACTNDPTFILNIEQFDKGAVEEFTARENPVANFNLTGVNYYC